MAREPALGSGARWKSWGGRDLLSHAGAPGAGIRAPAMVIQNEDVLVRPRGGGAGGRAELWREGRSLYCWW